MFSIPVFKPKPVPGVRKILGFHVNPIVSLNNNVRPASPRLFTRISTIASWVVMNFNKDWWDGSARSMLLESYQAATAAGLRIVVRLEDPSIVRPNTKVATPAWQFDFCEYATAVLEELSPAPEYFQVLNEVWCLGNESNWPYGAPSAADYVAFLRLVNSRIKSLRPGQRVTNAGITTVTEDRYFKYYKALCNAGMLVQTDAINLHYYTGRVSSKDKRRFNYIKRHSMDKPVVVTEMNHIDRRASTEAKLTIITRAMSMLYEIFQGNLRACCVFCANYTDHLAGWEVITTGLWDKLVEYVEKSDEAN